MASDRFDLIVLGAGSAARDGAKRAAEDHDANVVLVESTRWGGACPNVACNPTKAYLVAAELAHDVERLGDLLGIEVGPARPKLAKIKARKDDLLKPQPQWLEELSNSYTTVKGVASFVDEGTLRVGERELTADRILIATGSKTAVPPIDGLDDVDWLDHVRALELTELPRSLLVVGGGPVGLELAQAFARFGSSVTIVEGMERIAGKADADAAAQLARALEGEGIEIATGTIVKRVGKEGREIVATLTRQDDGDERELRVEELLIAAGRKPDVDELALEKARVATNDDGYVEVDEHLRTSTEGIWAAGDVAGTPQFTPLAQYQARIAVKDMFDGDAPSADYSALPTVIFTDPELAAIGLPEHEAEEQGLEVETATHELKMTRARYKNLKHGLFKLVYERGSRRLVGLHVVAPSASEIVAGYAVAMKLGATVDDLARVHHAYPTFGEGVKAAAEKVPTAVAV